jgi:hypothetical protein
MDIESLMTDSTLESEGVWVPIGNGGKIRVAREGNEAYQDYLHGLVTANRASIDQNDKASRKLQKDLLVRAYAYTVLKDVEGIRFKGQEITKYTPTIGLELLAIPDFFKKVQGYAQQFELYQKKAEDAAVGN